MLLGGFSIFSLKGNRIKYTTCLKKPWILKYFSFPSCISFCIFLSGSINLVILAHTEIALCTIKSYQGPFKRRSLTLYGINFIKNILPFPTVLPHLWRTDSGSKLSKLDKLPTFFSLPNSTEPTTTEKLSVSTLSPRLRIQIRR